MKFKITIDLSNDAFQENANFSIAAILDEVSEDLTEILTNPEPLNGKKLRDINGNTVGRVTVTK